MTYAYNGIPKSNEKDEIALNNIEKCHKHNAKWSKPDTEEYILYDFIYLNWEAGELIYGVESQDGGYIRMRNKQASCGLMQ